MIKMKRMLTLLAFVTVLALTIGGCTPIAQEPNLPADNPEPLPEPEPEPTEPDPYLILVNADNPLVGDLELELKTIQGNFKLEEKAADAYLQMKEAAKADGISLLVVSAHRPVATQERLYKNKVQEYVNKGYSETEAATVAATIVARPGTSEHHTGLAVDIVTPDFQRLVAAFADTPAGRWLAANAHKYGFVLRYPKDKTDITGIIYEPWHFRYVGLEHAQYMYENNLCLEEYLSLID
ncbi:MAG: M15 family metallopeptidase [Firmicutes bacterium]|nr:M15 family metallopeptidase [Bacillota bacterium]